MTCCAGTTTYQAAAYRPAADGTRRGGSPAEPLPVLPVSVTITPDGVAVAWPDGTETLARPPCSQD